MTNKGISVINETWNEFIALVPHRPDESATRIMRMVIDKFKEMEKKYESK